MTITVYCDKVSIPAMSTVGYGSGLDNDGRRVTFVGDHRPMRYISEAVEAEGEVPVELETYQILEVKP